MRAIHTLLAAFQVLHERGYEGLKVYTEIYETGHWRCGLGVVGQPRSFDDSYRYTSAAGWAYFASVDSSEPFGRLTHDGIPPERLADLFAERHPEFLRGSRFTCKPYAVWYELLLRTCGRDGCFVLQDSAGGFDARQQGFGQIRHDGGEHDRFPLAPCSSARYVS